MIKQEIFETGGYYHVFNKTVGNELLFREHDNYLFFMNKVKKYLSEYIDVLAYCLLPNHFHFLIAIKDIDISKTKYTSVSELISRKFSHLFNAYVQAYNKLYSRSGSLFQNRFKRILINKQEYLQKLIVYIHTNPQHHDICDDFAMWQYSSYNAIIGTKVTLVAKGHTLEWFDDIDNFMYCHRQKKISLSEKMFFE